MIEKGIPITVIINMYKGEATVSRMIDCVLNQTFKDFELILVDDGSPDRCGDIADEYAKIDDRVRVLHKPNGGLADARNKGLEIAKGEYTIQFDQDDWLEPNCLAEMYAEAIKQNADVVICDLYRNDQYRQMYVSQKPTTLDHWAVLEDLLRGKICGYCWNKLIRLAVYRKYDVKFPIEFYGCEDQYGMAQVFKYDIKIVHLPEAYCHYLYVVDSLSRHYDDRTFETDLVCRDMFAKLLKNTSLENLAYTSKSGAIFTRAFLLGKEQFTSSAFKKQFSPYYPYVQAHGIERILYAMAYRGYYCIARNIFEVLFQIKQIGKRFRKRI